MKNTSSWLVTAACLALPLAAVAQANPIGAGTPEAPRYASAFADYKPWQPVRPGDWRSLNDALAKPPAAQEQHGAPAPAISAAPPADAANRPRPSAPGHEAHHGHGAQK